MQDDLSNGRKTVVVVLSFGAGKLESWAKNILSCILMHSERM